MLVLAQIESVNPQWLVNMVIFTAAGIFIWSSIMQAVNGRRQQKRDVTLMEEFATRKELGALAEKVETKFDGLRCDLREMETRILDKGEERAVLLHNRLNEFGDRLGVLRGRVEGPNRTGHEEDK